MKNKLEWIRKSLSKNDINNAIEMLQSMTDDLWMHKNEIILFSARYRQLETDDRKGLLNREETRLETNRIVNDLLDFVDQIAEDNRNSKTSGSNNEQLADNYRAFISYRRSDSGTIVDRINDRLSQEFGNDIVFRDITGIPPGVDFREYIENVLINCKLMLLIIGPTWTSVENDVGKKRLECNNDPVRIEIEIALDNRIFIYPVLVQDAKMPKENELPEHIKDIVYLNAIQVRNDPDFNNDITNLIQSIRKHNI